MRILIFSDSHGRDTNMIKAIELNRGRFDCCLHLGDGCREFEALAQLYPGKPFVTVNGNAEDFPGSPRVSETVLSLDGYRILLTHGHKYNVKNSLMALKYAAKEKECKIALYGHTHIEHNEYLSDDGLYIFNPGSISRPPLGHKPSFGVIELTPRGIVPSHGHIQ